MLARCVVCKCETWWRNPAEYVAHVQACEQIMLGVAAGELATMRLSATSKR